LLDPQSVPMDIYSSSICANKDVFLFDGQGGTSMKATCVQREIAFFISLPISKEEGTTPILLREVQRSIF
jgi:hypothetical protein